MAASRKLPQHLFATLGAQAGKELVTILDEIRADRRDGMAKIEDLRREMLLRFEHMDRQFAYADARFDRVDQRLGALETMVADVKADLMKWSFVFWCGAVASIAALAGVLG